MTQTKRNHVSTEVYDVLKQCRIEGKIVYLPQVQLDRKLYQDVNEALTRIGGKWNRKAKGHVFDVDPTQDLQVILETDMMPDKNPTSFFATPQDLALEMLHDPRLHRIPENAKRVLEPSAGTGNIAREVSLYCQARGINATIDCCEIVPKYQKALQDQGFTVIAEDFLSCRPTMPSYDAVIMNPPFSLEGDALAYITHIGHAWSLLAPGGVLIAIAPSGFAFREDRRIKQLRSLIEQYGSWHDTEDNAFKESGTGVKTVMISMQKPIVNEDKAPEYPTLEAYHQGLLKPMWQSLKAELIAAEHFNSGAELSLNEATRDRLGEVAASIIAIFAENERQRLEGDIAHDVEQLQDGVISALLPERERLYDFCHDDQYNLRRDLQDLSGTRTMITDIYYISDIIRL